MKKRAIVLRYVASSSAAGTTYKFKTIKGARGRAHTLVGAQPRKDPDGYAVDRKSGNCLFIVSGTNFEELFS